MFQGTEIRLKKIIGFFLFCLLAPVFFALSLPVSAADPGGEALMISPARLEELVNPGETITRSVKVVNNSTSPKKLFAFLRDFKSEGEEGVAKLIEPGSEEGAYISSWIKISGEGVDFLAGEEKQFDFSIEVPKTAGPGGYYGAIIFGTRGEEVRLDAAEKGAAIAVAQQAGTLILLQIKGEAQEDAMVRDFITDKEIYATPFAVKFTTRIENQGNVHLKPHGTIEVSNLLGDKVITLRVNDNGANILPRSLRKFENTWQSAMAFGRYKAVLALSYGTPAASGGAGKQTLSSIKFFWIFPWKIIAFLVLGLVFFGALVYLILKMYKNRAINKIMTEMGIGKEYYVKKYQGPSPWLHLALTILVIFIAVFILAAATYFLFFA
jgi:hypothetical protein